MAKFQGGLLPTVALSDAFAMMGYLFAASYAFHEGFHLACCGFCLVALAAGFGVLRFGLSESLFAAPHEAMAAAAAFVGLPCVGLYFFPWPALHSMSAGLLPLMNDSLHAPLVISFACVEAATRGTTPAVRELSKILMNLVLFVVPVIHHTYSHQNWEGLGAILLFTVAGLNTDKHKTLFGMRMVNWFHYIIGATAPTIAMALNS